MVKYLQIVEYLAFPVPIYKIVSFSTVKIINHMGGGGGGKIPFMHVAL